MLYDVSHVHGNSHHPAEDTKALTDRVARKTWRKILRIFVPTSATSFAMDADIIDIGVLRLSDHNHTYCSATPHLVSTADYVYLGISWHLSMDYHIMSKEPIPRVHKHNLCRSLGLFPT